MASQDTHEESSAQVIRAAAIDLGSNAARLAVFELEEGRRLTQIDELRGNVRLSSGAAFGGPIRAEAFQLGLEILSGFATYCEAAGIERIQAVATSAVRDAENGAAFVAAVLARCGLELKILGGEEEARLGVLAVANGFAFEEALVLDLGGGSAQLSRMSGRCFAGGRSWPIGTVRMTEAFMGSDPPRPKELRALRARVRARLEAEPPLFGYGAPLVGMGGTLRNLAKLERARRGDAVSPLHGYILSAESLSTLAESLATMSLAQRRALAGLNGERADVIVAGALIAAELAAAVGADRLIVSGHGIREGLMYPFLLPGRDPPLVENVRQLTLEGLVRRWYPQPAHNRHVQKLALELFDGFACRLGLGALDREVLSAAALLHDVGMAVEYHAHHRHGRYLVMSGPLPGFSHREQAMIALLVGRHRKGKVLSEGLGHLLEPGDLERATRLVAMLRLAEYLDRSKAQKVLRIQPVVSAALVRLVAHTRGDAALELFEASARTDLLEDVVGMPVELVAAPA